jgi:O-antigen/teichoic acid export membrane protein
MSRAQILARQAARLFTGTLLAKGLDLALYLLLAQTLGAVEFGRYMFALSFTLLFNALGDLGLSTVFTREVSRAPEHARALLRPVLIIKLALSGIVLLLVPIAARFGPGGRESLALVVPIVAGMLLNSTALVFDGLLRAVGRAGRSGLNLTLQSTVALVCGAGLLGIGLGPRAGAYAFLIGAVVRTVSAIAWSHDLWGWSRARLAPGAVSAPAEPLGPLPAHAPLAMLREAAPLALSGLFIALYFRVDSVVLRALQGERAVGLYGGAYRMFEAFTMLAVTFRSVLFPVMSRAADGPTGSLAALCRKSIRLNLLFTFGVAVFFTFEAPAIVRVVLGPGYAASAPALAILMWALPGSYMADTLVFLITAQRRQTLTTWAVGVTAAFNVVLNLLLVPGFSILGSSVATVASEWLSFGLLFVMFQRAAPVAGMAAVVWRPLVAGALLATGLAALSSRVPVGIAGLALVGLASVVAYGLALVGLGAIGRDDLEIARGLLPGVARRGRGSAP